MQKERLDFIPCSWEKTWLYLLSAVVAIGAMMSLVAGDSESEMLARTTGLFALGSFLNYGTWTVLSALALTVLFVKMVMPIARLVPKALPAARATLTLTILGPVMQVSGGASETTENIGIILNLLYLIAYFVLFIITAKEIRKVFDGKMADVMKYLWLYPLIGTVAGILLVIAAAASTGSYHIPESSVILYFVGVAAMVFGSWYPWFLAIEITDNMEQANATPAQPQQNYYPTDNSQAYYNPVAFQPQNPQGYYQAPQQNAQEYAPQQNPQGYAPQQNPQGYAPQQNPQGYAPQQNAPYQSQAPAQQPPFDYGSAPLQDPDALPDYIEPEKKKIPWLWILTTAILGALIRLIIRGAS